jgi:hypothetical protein
MQNHRIAGLNVAIPKVGDLVARCGGYPKAEGAPDMVIREELFRPYAWPRSSENLMIYLESGIQFGVYLLRYNGLMLHASAAERGGRAYLFSGQSGIGKSTHVGLWQREFGDVTVLNDDKPALRRMEDGWIAYGTPWCGKDGINCPKSAPIAGICFLKRGDTAIKRLSPAEGLERLLPQTLYQLSAANMELLLPLADRLISEIPMWELTSHADPECAHLTWETMSAS